MNDKLQRIAAIMYGTNKTVVFSLVAIVVFNMY